MGLIPKVWVCLLQFFETQKEKYCGSKFKVAVGHLVLSPIIFDTERKSERPVEISSRGKKSLKLILGERI